MSRRNLFWATSVTVISLVCWHAATSAPRDGNYDLFRAFVETLNQVEREYVRELNQEELFQGGLIGIMESVDLDSSYLSPAVYQFAKEHPESRGDVGLQLTMRPAMHDLGRGDSAPVYRQVFVLGVVPGSPAEQAGILPGDMLVDVDEHHVARWTLEEVVQHLQGDPGTEVTLKLFRVPETRRGTEEAAKPEDPQAPDQPNEAPDDEPMDPDVVNPDGTLLVTLKRAKIDLPGIIGVRHLENGDWDYWVDTQKGVAYVRLPALTPGTAAKLSEVVQQLRAQDQHQLKGLVLDLRFNSGGSVPEAVAAADLFVSEGRLLSLSGPNVAEEHWEAHGQATWSDLPLVVLVNRYTAGPAEVLAAALQDHSRAKVLGERTLGKGGVSRIIPLSDGKSALRLTVATYERPNGKSLYRRRDAKPDDAWGVQPDAGLRVRQAPQHLVRYLRWRAQPKTDDASDMKDYVDDALTKAADVLNKQLAEAAASS